MRFRSLMSVSGHGVLASAPPAVVEQSTRLRTRPGRAMANSWATIPPARNPDDVRRGETQPVEHRHRVAGHRSGRGGKHPDSVTSPTPGARHRRR